MKTIYTKNEVQDLIGQNKVLLLAGDESLFKDLPKGNWIGGSIPYFMGDNGGVTTKDSFFVTILPEECSIANICQYPADKLENIIKDYPDNGVSYIIIPAMSETHTNFAINITQYTGLFNTPLVGWIAGLHLDDLGKVTPKVFNGKTGEFSLSDAVVMHTALPEGTYAKSDIINLFKQGDGDTIEFNEEGFEIVNAIVNGKEVNFSDYLVEKSVNLQLPLVANYSGAMVNVSFQNNNTEEKKVQLYAPVFKGMEYKIAAPLDNYEINFVTEVASRSVAPIFACNCILNYLYAGLEGKSTGEVKGPMTFGEIAYMLLNQTLVYVTLEKED